MQGTLGMLLKPGTEEGPMAVRVGHKVGKVDPETQGGKEVVGDSEEI